MLVSDFSYDLPEALIAQYPCEPRDCSRLMVLDRMSGNIMHRHFYDIADYFQPGDTLVFNDTKVIPARLIGARSGTGGKIEVFLLHQLANNEWEVLVKPGKRARIGTTVNFGEELSCEILAVTDFGGRVVHFHFNGQFTQILDRLGETPLPPYIHRQLADKDRYQTVYARESGSAAAPTAGLHFTSDLMRILAGKGINLAFVTLHVGLGTFRPVGVEDVSQHTMHREYYSVAEETAQLINQTKATGKKVVAVGTTAIRTLETVGYNGKVMAKSGWTDIFIYPGYQFKVVDSLITNFHLPKSTLLMLVSAFAGREKILAAYQQAIKSNYRFFSFGDAMLIL